MKKYIFSLLTALTMLCQGVSAQNITASGTVTDATHEPLIGATVKVAGEAQGAITDMDGNFELQCKQGAQLEISYVGYLTQTVKAGNGMRIVL